MKAKGTFLVPTLGDHEPLGDPRGAVPMRIALQLRTRAMMRPLREAVEARALGSRSLPAPTVTMEKATAPACGRPMKSKSWWRLV
jgi:hypothetical protein